METLGQQFTVEVPLHGVECLLTLKTREEGLVLKLEEKPTGQIWKGDFTSKYIEDITQKTGNFKKFQVFVKMLSSALKNETPSVHIDILTAQDLEELKSKKAGATTKLATTSTKRYLILTSTSEFEKVHYPLPLSYEEIPDPETLKQTIARLSSEIENFRCRTASVAVPDNISEAAKASFYSEAPFPNGYSTSRTVEEIKGENDRLKRKLALLEKMSSGSIDDISSKLDKYKDVDRYLKESELEAKTLRDKLNETQSMLQETKSELFRTRGELGHYEQLQGLPDPEVLHAEIERLRAEMEKERKANEETFSKQNEILSVNKKELEKAKEGDKTLKNKVKELEKELEAALKKASYSMYGSRGPSRPNSTSSRKSNASYKYSPAASRTSSNQRSSSVPQRKPINSRPNPVRNNYMKQVPARPNKFQPRYSPAASRSNSGNSYGKRTYQGTNRPSPGIARRSPATDNKISPLRAANQTRPAVPAARNPIKKDTPGVFSRLYGGNSGKKCETVNNQRGGEENRKFANINKEMKDIKGSDIDDRLKKLQNIIKAAKA